MREPPSGPRVRAPDLQIPSSMLSLLRSIVFMTAFLRAFAGFAGGDVSGGGSSIRLRGQEPFLLDFIMIDPSFREPRGSAPVRRTIQFPLAPEAVIFGLPVTPAQLSPEAEELMRERLKLWEGNSPETVALIRATLSEMTWRISPLAFHIRPDTYLPPELGIDRGTTPISAASAVHRDWGVMVIGFMWDEILRGTTSRAGLFIHESLRFLQVEGRRPLRDETIQRITALLMLRAPGKPHELDDLLAEDARRAPAVPGPVSSQRLLRIFLFYFSPTSRGGFSAEERAFITEVYQEALGGDRCSPGTGCVAIPSKYFPDGVPLKPRKD